MPTRPDDAPAPRRVYTAIAASVAALFFIVLVRTAWISDDALITLRTILNLTHGFGLVFNIAERVQAYTHPLWLLVLTPLYLILRNIYSATFMASIVISVLALAMAVRFARSAAQAWLVAGVLLCSHAFVDYSTSGLENPLSHVLIAATVLWFLNDGADRSRWLIGLWTLTSLIYLTRPDDVLLVLPLVAAACWHVRRPGTILTAAAVGLLPAIVWTGFSLVYYGFPFPNTAYAKLGTGINAAERWQQGWIYLVDSLDRDPLTLLTIAVAAGLALATRSRGAVAIAIGLAVHLLYVASIGGDFMAGRFLTAPFFMAVMALSQATLPSRAWLAPAAVVLGAAGLVAPNLPLASDSRYESKETKTAGIVDERGMYFAQRSVVKATRQTFREPDWPSFDGAAHPPVVLELCGLLGITGIDAGPYAHLIDECGLGDPLLARLPAVWNDRWRQGHFRRFVPDGYHDSIARGENVLADPALHEYYDHLQTVTRSTSLWSFDRFREISRFNRGKFDGLINRPFYRYNGQTGELRDLTTAVADGTKAGAPATRLINDEYAVFCEPKAGRRYLAIALDSADPFKLTFLLRNATVGVLELGPIPEHRRVPGIVTYVAEVPAGAQSTGFDTVVVVQTGGEAPPAMGHFWLDGNAATDEQLHRLVARESGRQ